MNTSDPSTLPPQTEENIWEWERLLAERPEMAERFTRWDLLGGFAWARLLSRRPETCGVEPVGTLVKQAFEHFPGRVAAIAANFRIAY